MPEQGLKQGWNPVEELKKLYPKVAATENDDQIYEKLLNPAKFRAAFPEYAKMSDAEIRRGVAKFGKPTPQAVIDKYKKKESGPIATAAREAALGFASGIGLPESTHASDFLAVPGLTQIARHPIESGSLIGESIASAHADQFSKAKDAFKEGIRSADEGKLDANAAYRTAIHGVAGVVPIVGPAAESFGEEIGTPGMRAHGVGGAVGLITGLGAGTEKGKAVAAKAEKLVAPAVDATKRAVGNTARGYAEKVSSKMTGLLPDRDTGINIPGRVAEATRKVTTLKTAADKYELKATQATQEVGRLATEASQKGVALSAPETQLIYKMMDTLTKRSSNLKAMQDFTSLGLDQLKSTLWNTSKRTPYINAEQMLELRRDLDELVNYESKAGKVSPVSAAAHKVRTALDQNLDSRIPGWKDANEKASAMIKTKEALLKRKDREFFTTAKATLTDVLKHPVGTLGAGFGAYELSQAAGAPHYVNYVAAIGASTIAHVLYESLPSQTARIMMADSLADMLIGKRAPKGPASYAQPPTMGPGRQLGAPQPAPQGGPGGGGQGTPQTGQNYGTKNYSQAQAEQAQAQAAATQAFREAAKKAGMKDAEIDELIQKASQPKVK